MSTVEGGISSKAKLREGSTSSELIKKEMCFSASGEARRVQSTAGVVLR